MHRLPDARTDALSAGPGGFWTRRRVGRGAVGADGRRQGTGHADRGGGQRRTGEPQLLGYCHGSGLAVAERRGKETDGQIMTTVGEFENTRYLNRGLD